MLNLDHIAYKSIISTSRNPGWWILAFVQVVAFAGIGELAYPDILFRPGFFWLAVSVVILIPSTVLLWLEIEYEDSKIKKEIPNKVFFNICLESTKIIILGLISSLAFKFFSIPWVFSAVISSLIASTSAITMLYIVLCRSSFEASFALALDTWRRKTSLAALAAVVLILGHGVSFAFVHGIWRHFILGVRFSVLSHSATIWILLAMLAFLIVLFSAALNCFLVLVFLEIVKQKKAPETESETAVPQVALQGNP